MTCPPDLPRPVRISAPPLHFYWGRNNVGAFVREVKWSRMLFRREVYSQNFCEGGENGRGCYSGGRITVKTWQGGVNG